MCSIRVIADMRRGVLHCFGRPTSSSARSIVLRGHLVLLHAALVHVLTYAVKLIATLKNVLTRAKEDIWIWALDEKRSHSVRFLSQQSSNVRFSAKFKCPLPGNLAACSSERVQQKADEGLHRRFQRSV